MEPLVFCPDCEKEIPQSEFIAHREREHPPATIAVTPRGIASQTRFGTDPPKES